MTDSMPKIHFNAFVNNLPGVIKAYHAYEDPNWIYKGKTSLELSTDPIMSTLLTLLNGVGSDEVLRTDSKIVIESANDRISDIELTESLYYRVRALKYDQEIDGFVNDLKEAVS